MCRFMNMFDRLLPYQSTEQGHNMLSSSGALSTTCELPYPVPLMRRQTPLQPVQTKWMNSTTENTFDLGATAPFNIGTKCTAIIVSRLLRYSGKKNKKQIVNQSTYGCPPLLACLLQCVYQQMHSAEIFNLFLIKLYLIFSRQAIKNSNYPEKPLLTFHSLPVFI